MTKNLCLKVVATALLILCGGGWIFAQQKVSGTVLDGNNQPVVGATVMVQGTQNGAVVDIDGKWTLTVPTNSTLVAACIGYADETVRVSASTSTYNFVLHEDAEYLNDAILIGYQVVKRRDLTGSVSSITGEELAKIPVATVTQAMQGMLPGVNVMSQDGRPGATTSIRVRGGGSITQSNEPLYIVDGVQMSNLDDIPADNVKSIDVLKDAASTAIYGARGANGVILVTTKSGAEGNANVRYNAFYQYKVAPPTLETLDAYDYVFHNWAYATAYGASYGDGAAKYFGLGPAYGDHLAEYKNVKVHNYVNDIVKPSSTWNHDLSISGGNRDTKYFVSVNYMDDDGVRVNSGFKRFGANLKLSQKIMRNLNLDIDLRYHQSENWGTGMGNATSAYKFRPIDTPLGEDNPALLGQGDGNVSMNYDPRLSMYHSENIRDNYRLRANASLAWTPIPGFVAKTEFGGNRSWSEGKSYDDGYSTGNKKATLSLGDGVGYRWTTTLSYLLPFKNKDHSLTLLAGNEVLSSVSNSTSINGAFYPDSFDMDQVFGMIHMTGFNSSGTKEDKFSHSIGTPSHTLSWFGRANYSFKGRYLLSASLRADGSSKFAPNNHWGYFPAASAAWRIIDEPFMRSLRGTLSDLKLRLSYGTSGADNISPSLWKETWSSNIVTIEGVQMTSYAPGGMLPNPDLMWETTISRNLGLDFSFLKGRIRGSIDAYLNNTKDLLMQIPCDASSGYTYQYQNIGRTSNRGIEVSLAGEIVSTKEFSLSANLIYSYNRNLIDDLPDGVNCDLQTYWTMMRPSYDYIIREGQPVGTVNGYVAEGFYTVDDFDFTDGKYVLKPGIPDFSGSVVNYPVGMKKLIPTGQVAFPGAAKFKDVNENGSVDDDDATIIADMIPPHTGGFNLNARFKGFDLSANFTYALGGHVYNAEAMYSMTGNKDTFLGNNRLYYVADCWQPYSVKDNGEIYLVTDPSELARLNANAKHPVPYSEYGICTSEFIENGSYLRLNTLTLGYTIPRKVLERVNIKNARIYATMGNVFCLDAYSGLDPDVNTRVSTSGGFPTPYFDFQSYPKARSFTFGVNVSF